ncbi:hypothetical protein MHU86_25068 [Fragilaria crotonensis]|nr:hypothetical protein MHU86_25068 [Fragilaria crotonensis]
MGVRPGTVDGRVPQQTPRRTRTLSESAARDSRREPTRTNLLAPPCRRRRISRQPATTRHETKSGLGATLRPRLATDRPPVARALSPGDAHDAPTSALADTPRPLPGKFPSLVPLPTIPLPNVDSPFPTPEPRLADALATILHSGQPRTHATEFRFDWTHDAARHNLAVLQRYALDLDAALRAQPFSALTLGSEFRHRTSRSCPPTLWRVFRSASRRGRVPFEISDSDRLTADVRLTSSAAITNRPRPRGKVDIHAEGQASRGSYHRREKPP